MINNVVMLGRLVENPELRKTPSAISVTKFTIAVDRNSSDKQTDFFDVVAWRQTAEFICKYFSKGAMIAITGSIQTRSYEDKNGVKRKAFEIVVSQASFCGSKSEPSAIAEKDSDFEEIGADEDLPF